MKKSLVLLIVCLPLAFGQEKAQSSGSAQSRVTVEKISAEKAEYYRQKMAKMRAALAGQVAVRDAAEQSYRRANVAEAAALAGTTESAPPDIRALPGGGSAVAADISQVEFLVAERGSGGKIAVTHKAPAPKTEQKQGGRHVR